ncbi:MAG TPA: GTP pyrophosphokinase family protein [Clostridiaceae bacterium]
MAVIREWKAFLIPYEQAVEEMKIKFRSIRKEYRSKNEYSPIEFITGRVKEISSIIEKSNKFNIPLERVNIEMEDIAGIRIMCQFVDDIEKVVALIRERKDMSIIYEKDYVANVKVSGYRSYHMIIKYPVNLAEGQKDILAELQIRTLAMNFWATVEHSLNYKYKQDIPNEIKLKLKAAADLAFQLDEQMLDIKDEIKDAQRLFEIKSSLSVNIINNINTLTSLGRFSESMKFQIQLDKLIDEGEISELYNLLEMSNKVMEKCR